MDNLFEKGQVIDFSPISVLPLLGVILDAYCVGSISTSNEQAWKYTLIIYSGGKLIRTTAIVIDGVSTTYSDCTLLLEDITHHYLDGVLFKNNTSLLS